MQLANKLRVSKISIYNFFINAPTSSIQISMINTLIFTIER